MSTFPTTQMQGLNVKGLLAKIGSATRTRAR
jgi:hypothetical protein